MDTSSPKTITNYHKTNKSNENYQIHLMLFSNVIVEMKTKYSKELALSCLNIDRLYREALGKYLKRQRRRRRKRDHLVFIINSCNRL